MSNPPAGQETARTETELERIVHKQRPIVDSGTAFILMTKFARTLERELAAAKAQLAEALESERLKLAACGVAALQNTPESAKERLTRDNPYWTASYDDVCRAVDQQMELRAQLAAAREDMKRYQWLRDNDGGGQVIINWNVGHDWVSSEDLDADVAAAIRALP